MRNIDDLLGQYWDLAHKEGKTGESQGSEAAALLYQLRSLFRSCSTAVYEHTKGGQYVIRDEVTNEADLKPHIVYQDILTGQKWSRSKEEFFDGRFKVVPDKVYAEPPAVGPLVDALRHVYQSSDGRTACMSAKLVKDLYLYLSGEPLNKEPSKWGTLFHGMGSKAAQGIAREARNQVCMQGHLNEMLLKVMRSNEPDGTFNLLGSLCGTAIDITLELVAKDVIEINWVPAEYQYRALPIGGADVEPWVACTLEQHAQYKVSAKYETRVLYLVASPN
jgi:hypothetical protein